MEGGNRTIQYLSAFAVCLAGVSTGAVLTWTTAVIPKFHDNQTGFKLTDAEISWLTAVGSLGFMTGSLTSRYVSDSFGRRATVLGSALPIIVGTIIMLSTSNIWILCLCRLLAGTGCGMVGTASTMYLAEIADKEVRGTLSVGYRFMLNLGVFLMMAVGPFISYQSVNYMYLVLPVFYFVACIFVPETPYYYLKEGKVDEARKSLTMLRGVKDEKVLEDELSVMRSAVNREMSRASSVKELLTGMQYRKAVIVTFGLKFCQILSGVIVMQHYLGTIIKESNYTMKLGTVFILFGAIRFAVGVMSSAIADKVGRRPLLIYSHLGAFLSLSLVAAYFFCQEILQIEENKLSPYAIVVFLGIILTNVISNLGYNSIFYAVQGEVFPLNVKSVAMTTLNIIGGMLNFLVTKSYQSWKDLTGLFGVFAFFSVISLFAVVFVYFNVPETRGKSLAEIQVLLQGVHHDDFVDKVQVTKDINGTQDTELKPMISKQR